MREGASTYSFAKILLILLCTALQVQAGDKDTAQYGAGLTVNLPFPEAQVLQIVQDVAQNGIIRGSKEYNKDEYITGAVTATSTHVFPEWTEGGKVFYKVRLKALNPRNFKDSGDIGTLAVRYVVQEQGPSNTVLRIDARFVEDFRHITHASNGSVEGAEYKDIHDKLDAIEMTRARTVEAQKEQQEQRAKNENPRLSDETTPAKPEFVSAPPAEVSVQAPPQTLEERVRDLRRQVERKVKSPGAPLKSAPFHTATTLQSLLPGTEVLIVISTPYWFGVETHAGQHGWMLRDELELVP